MFIHEKENWTLFRWDKSVVDELKLQAAMRLGYLAGRMAAIGFEDRLTARVESLTNDVVASSAIEGIRLDTEEVRSSVARKLGAELPVTKDSSHYVDGIVEMMLDATHNRGKSLTKTRLCNWHCALFPHKCDLIVGEYRNDEMSVVSGTFGRERIHYRAPHPERVPAEMEHFLNWFNDDRNKPDIIKSAIAHLWFVSIHPFDDGNGRIGRAISDMVLADIDYERMNYYSFSRQILKDKSHYYRILEKTQRGNGDITEWLKWYIDALMEAIDNTNYILSQVLRKATFWQTFSQADITPRQRTVLNKYLDGYDAKITAKNWAKAAGVSTDTALRDINSLVNQGILTPTPGRVRDIPYSINYTRKNNVHTADFKEISIEKVGNDSYIKAIFKGKIPVEDKVSNIDILRLNDGEITITDLAYKHFAYLL